MLVWRGFWGKLGLLLKRFHSVMELANAHMQLGSVFTSPSCCNDAIPRAFFEEIKRMQKMQRRQSIAYEMIQIFLSLTLYNFMEWNFDKDQLCNSTHI
jgi:hypothetical protein